MYLGLFLRLLYFVADLTKMHNGVRKVEQNIYLSKFRNLDKLIVKQCTVKRKKKKVTG